MQEHEHVSNINDISVANSTLTDKHWYDWLSKHIADFLTSLFIIMIVMITFLIGIASHIQAVFGSWFLAIGFQSVVLLTSVSADLLPRYRNIPVVAACMSVLTAAFVFLSFDGHLSDGVMLFVNVLKSVAIALVEFIFAYLFVARNNRMKAELQGYVFGLHGEVLGKESNNIATAADVDEHAAVQDDKNEVKFTDDKVEVDCPVDESLKEQFDIVNNNVKLLFDIVNNNGAQLEHFECECGEEFDDKATYDKHIANCFTHKWHAENR